MNKKIKLPDKMLLRILILILGLFCIAFGVALSTKSDLGVAPSAAIPYVLCQVTPLSMGVITTIINVVMVLLQIVILRKRFKAIQLMQLVIVFIFGYFTDWTLSMCAGLSFDSYVLKLIFTVIGCALMGLGVFLEVEAGLIPLSSDGLASAVADVSKIKFGLVKNIIDGSQVVIAVVLAFVLLGSLFGIREGTIICAVLVGIFIQIYNRYLAFIHRAINLEKYEYDLAAIAGLTPKVQTMVGSPEEELVKMKESPSSYPLIITIEREYGSGGYEIGKRIAEALNIPFYDHRTIEEMAKEFDMPYEGIAVNEDSLPAGMIQSIYRNSFSASRNVRIQDNIFKAQSRAIREIANKGESCVIVGRLANHVLNPRPNCFNVFVSGNYEFRADYLQKRYGYDGAKAMQLIRREDLARARYCKHFTGCPWGLSRHFTMTIDCSEYGITASTKIVLDSINSWKEKHTNS